MTLAAHALPLTISEASFQSAVLDLAMLQGWRCAHFRAARVGRRDNERWVTPMQGHTGWPDLALARDGVLLLRELKRHGGRLTPEQRAWGRALGDMWAVWTPGEWALIVATLTGKNTARTA